MREGVEQKSGARNLKRVIERYLVGPLANLVSTRQIGGCDTVKIDYTKGEGKLKFMREDRHDV